MQSVDFHVGSQAVLLLRSSVKNTLLKSRKGRIHVSGIVGMQRMFLTGVV